MRNYVFKIGLWLVAMLTAIQAYAYDIEVDGIYYNVTSTYNLTCEVTSGDNHYKGDVVIPSEITYNSRKLNVTSIRDGAFDGCSSLTSVTIPNSVRSIEENAFRECSSLVYVKLS